jgi:hypothetical protein
MLLIRLGLLVGVAVTLHGAVPMLSEGPVAALAAGPKGELTPEELHARAEQFRDRVGADQGDELVYRVAACLQQADEEGTLNDAWAEQCAQDIAAQLLAPPAPETSGASVPPEPVAGVAAPVPTPVIAPPVTTEPPVADPPASPDDELMDDCLDIHGIGAIDLCASMIHGESTTSDCVFLQVVVLGADLNGAQAICGSLPVGGEQSVSQSTGAPPPPAPVPTATQVIPAPAVAKPAGENNQARCREIEERIAAFFDTEFFQSLEPDEGAEAKALSEEYVRLGCQPPG